MIFGGHTQRTRRGKILRLRLDWLGPSELTEEGLREAPRTMPGVYVVQDHWAERGVFPVAYAGKTEDLRLRLQAHARGAGSPWVAAAATSRRLLFSCAQVLDPNLRAAAEAALIWIFQPRYNRQVPAVAPILITLPPYKEK